MEKNNLSPNNDFYLYVNQKWLSDNKNKIPEDYSSWGGFTKLYDIGLQNQIKIVKNLKNKISLSSLTETEKKIFAIWKASENRFNSWKENTCDCNPIINELNILDKHFNIFYDTEKKTIVDSKQYIDCLGRYLHYTQINGISNVIDFDTGSDLKNVNNIVLDFSVGGLSLPSREYYKSDKFKDKFNLFKGHLTNIKTILEHNSVINLDAEFVDNVISFEEQIADFTMKPDQSREYDKYYTNTTLTELYENINNLNSLPEKQNNYNDNEKNLKVNTTLKNKVSQLFEKLYTHFNFREILKENREQNFFIKQKFSNPPTNEHITAYDGDAIRRCMKLILNIDNFQKYKSYMQYQIIKNYNGFCVKELDDEFFDFYSRKLGGQNKPKPNEKRSINIVNAYAGEMLGQLFVKKYFPETSKENMENLVKNIIDETKTSLQNNDWLTKETKNTAVIKLANFKSKIGYPDTWKDYSDFNIKIGDSLYEIYKKSEVWSLRVNFFDKINSVLDRNEWRMTPQTVNAYFMPTQNEIVFPAAILQPPFFHQSTETIDFDIQEELSMFPNLDVVTIANYGGIGAVIAHEITHGYDDQGRKFDKDGNLNDWWTKEDEELFKKKTETMIKSVSKYIYSVDDKKYKMNGQLTMGENLADIGGLSISMKALIKSLKLNNTGELESKAALRIFFKSWANVWKQNIKKDKRIMLLNVDPHAPTDFRGNLVQHMNEFYDAFDIKEGDKMFLEKIERMNMW